MSAGSTPTTAAFVSILITLASRIGFSPVIDVVRQYRDTIPVTRDTGPKLSGDDIDEQVAACNVAITKLKGAEQLLRK